MWKVGFDVNSSAAANIFSAGIEYFVVEGVGSGEVACEVRTRL